jgi:tetratricopeptide (TPR) repeat protein
VWQERGDDREALAEATRALALYDGIDAPVWQARAANAVGWFHARLGHHDDARRHCQRALRQFQQHQNAQGEADTLDSLDYLAHETGDPQAQQHYQQALALYRQLGDAYSEANTLHRLGDLHAARHEPDRAAASWREALALYRQQGRLDRCQQVDRKLAE